MMKSPAQFFRFGQFEIRNPCEMSWEEMDDRNDGSRFCSQCSKSVFDLTGKSPGEIRKITDANGGRICGSFLLDREKTESLRPSAALRLAPSCLKYFAAVAALMLVQQTPHASAIFKAPIAIQRTGGGDETKKAKTNTLVTGIIQTQNDEVAQHELVMQVYINGKKHSSLKSSFGLFSLDLSGLAEPDATIKFVIKSQVFFPGKKYQEHKYAAATHSAKLGDAQNLVISIHHIPPPTFHRMTGAVNVF